MHNLYIIERDKLVAVGMNVGYVFDKDENCRVLINPANISCIGIG